MLKMPPLASGHVQVSDRHGPATETDYGKESACQQDVSGLAQATRESLALFRP